MTHLAFIRSLPCCRCGRSPSQAAHVRLGTGGGTGMKPDDRWTVPLCADCHREQHRVGERTFWDGDDPARLAAHLAGDSRHDDWEAAVRDVLRFRLTSRGEVA